MGQALKIYLQWAVAANDSQRRCITVNGSKSSDNNRIDTVLNVFVEQIGIPFNVVCKKVGRSAHKQDII